MLRIENAKLNISPTKTLFHNVNLSLEAGQILQVVGPNGIGKSSLLRGIVGQIPFGPIQWTDPKPMLSYLPQLANLSFHVNLKVRDILKFQNIDNEDEIFKLGFLDKSTLDLCWNSASGGERQRTLLTRSFLTPAKLLLLDEPTNHLDHEHSSRLLHVMNDYVQNKDKAILFISHKPTPEFRQMDLRDCL